MAILPRYRRLGVEAEAPTRIDYSPMREVAGLGQAISQNVDRMSDFIYREQVRRAEMAGQEAVREQGALPILQRLQEQGGPGVSIAEQAAYETANRVAVSEIQFEAENQISALLQSASDNNTPFSAVNTQLEDIVDGFSASLGYLNPEAAGLLQSRLRNSAADASRRYASVYQTRARAAAAERRSEVATGFATSALELARVEGSTPELLYSTLQENRQALIDSGMPEATADTWFNNAYGAAVRDNGLFRAMTAPLEDLRAEIDTVPTEPFPGMTYAETLVERGRMETVYNSRIAGYEADARALGSQIDTARNVLGSGGVVGPEALAKMEAEAERLGFMAPELQARVADLRADNTFIGNVRGMNIAELEAALAEYSGGMPGVGEPGVDTPEEVYRRDVVRRAFDAAVRAEEVVARDLGRQIDVARNVLESGGVVGPETLARFVAEAENLGVAPELRSAVADLQADSSFIESVRGMNRAELEVAINQYIGGMPGVGEPGIDTPEEVYRRDIVRRALDAAIRSEEAETAAAAAAAREAAIPALRLIETAAGVLDGVMTSATPNPLIAEEAMRTMMEAYSSLPTSIVTEDMRESMAEVQQTMAALESWRESQPAELATELERLRSVIPSVEDLPEGVDLIDQIAANQRQANLLSGFITTQQSALAGGQALAYAQSQGVMIEDQASNVPRVVGQPINLAGDPASVRASLDQRFREIDYVETRFGTAGQKVLLPQEVALIENILSEGQPGQRAVILGMIADQGADRAERIFKSLDLDNPEMRLYSHIGSLMTSGNERAAILALRGMDVEQPPAMRDAEVSRAFRAQVQDAFAYVPETAEAIRQTARLIYSENSSRNPDLAEMIRNDAWINAMSLAMGNLQVVQINNRDVVMEADISNDRSLELIRDWMLKPTNLPEIIANANLLGEYSFDDLKGGDWYPVAVGQDQYFLATSEDFNTLFWVDNEQDKNPIVISLRQLESSLMMDYMGGFGR
jgi:hypothetical protein